MGRKTWSTLGSGVFGGNLVGMWQSCVFSLAIDHTNNLYVGGEFLSAGQKTSPYIAKCYLNSVVSRQSRIDRKPPAGGLAYDSRTATICFNANSATAVSYRIYTLAGREVFSRCRGAAGRREVFPDENHEALSWCVCWSGIGRQGVDPFYDDGGRALMWGGIFGGECWKGYFCNCLSCTNLISRNN